MSDPKIELEIEALDPAGDDGAAFARTVLHSFHDGAPDEEWLGHWRRQVAHDGMRLYGVRPESAWGPTPELVATYASWTQSMNTGSGTVPLHMVTDVTVAATHRRRGLLRRMMTADLADAAARGLPLAALTASEGSIYGRFGFGAATRKRQVEVDTTRYALRNPLPDDPGHLRLVRPADAWPAIADVFERHLAVTRGAVARHQAYELILTGVYHPFERGVDKHLQVALHLDADGTPDGYVAFRYEGADEGRRTVEVRDLVALDPEVRTRLWSLVASVDLVERVRSTAEPVDSALEWSLAEPRAVRTTLVGDHLWLRVLDVPAALAARPWGADGTIVLGVRDALGHAEGAWALTARDGRGSVEATSATPEVTMDADTLGSLYLSDVPVATLHAAGRFGAASPAAVDRLAGLADVGPAPYCSTSF